MAENLWITELGVEVEDTPMSHLYGAYIHQHGLILLNDRLAPIQRRSTLMHELGHAFYGHTESTARTEREASEWAARQLIPGCEFDRLSKLYDNPRSEEHTSELQSRGHLVCRLLLEKKIVTSLLSLT